MYLSLCHLQCIWAVPTIYHCRSTWSCWWIVGGTPTLPVTSSNLGKTGWPERSWRREQAGIHQLRWEEKNWVLNALLQSHTTHTSSLTTVHCRSNGDVASLRVKGELVDVHLTGADHLHVLFGTDIPIIGYVDVLILRGVILLYPKTSQNLFMAWLSS